jgi:hypothetical protein
MRAWTPIRWIVALAAAALTVVVVGIPTALIPTGIFGRGVPAPWWAWPALLVTAVLSGLVSATYVRAPAAIGPSHQDPDTRRAGFGGFLAYLAVGCPSCNKIALLALGSTGAVRWFAPVQPVLAFAGIALLGYALQRRLAGERACPSGPGAPSAPDGNGAPGTRISPLTAVPGGTGADGTSRPEEPHQPGTVLLIRSSS